MKNWFLLCSFLAALLATMPLVQAAGPTIVVLGDSLSAAHGFAADQGWVSLLQKRLREQGYPHRVVNASVGGDTTRGGRERVNEVLQRHQPAILIVELGGNDGLRGLALDDMKQNLTAIIQNAQQHGAKVLLTGMKLPPNYGPRYVDEFVNVFVELARTLNTSLVPFLLAGLDQDRTGFQSDGIHPTAASQPRLLDNVWPHLVSLLQQTSAK